MSQENIASPANAQKAPHSNLECAQLFTDICELYKTSVRVHAVQNVPAKVMAASITKLSNLLNEATAAHIASDARRLSELLAQMRHFDEPEEVKVYYGQQFLQSHTPNNFSVLSGNR